MFLRKQAIPRRTVLRGLGTALALPWLDAMMPALHLSHFQIGILLGTFPLTYLICQIPGATFGRRFGARATYAGVGIIGMVALAGIPLAPVLFSGTGVFVALVLAQGLLGASQGPVFPLVAAVGQVWFPENRWSFINGTISTGKIGRAHV